MKKYLILTLTILLCGCNTYNKKTYVANMYAKGTLTGYEDTGTSCDINKLCPGCHIKNFDKVKLTVEEVLSRNNQTVLSDYNLDGCNVYVSDSLNLINISDHRYIPATNSESCAIIFDQEKSYLESMGFSE